MTVVQARKKNDMNSCIKRLKKALEEKGGLEPMVISVCASDVEDVITYITSLEEEASEASKAAGILSRSNDELKAQKHLNECAAAALEAKRFLAKRKPDKFWDILSRDNKSNLVHAISRDKDISLEDRKRLQDLAAKIWQAHVDALPVPNEEMMRLAEESVVKGVKLYRDVHKSPTIGLREASTAIRAALERDSS